MGGVQQVRGRPGIPHAAAAAFLLLVSVVAWAWPAHSVNYDQGVSAVYATQVTFTFTPATPSTLVDVHYLVNGAGQQNFRMTQRNGRWEKAAGSLPSGARLEYWFTYEKDGPLHDTPHFTYPHGAPPRGAAASAKPLATPTEPPTAPAGQGIAKAPSGGAGTFPLAFANNTRGAWRDDQVHVTVIGMRAAGQWAYLKPNGAVAPMDPAEEHAPGHLTKHGRDYANMSFTLSQASSVTVPKRWEGARAFISLGSPIYLPISPNGKSWGNPDLLDPGDPNADVHFDWYEFTSNSGARAFGGNTTQVDMFGFPITARVQQAVTGFDQTSGISLTREQVRQGFLKSVGLAFKPLAHAYRIVAPHSSVLFKAGGPSGGYLQAVIDQVWNRYVTGQFELRRGGSTFTGKVADGRLRFTKDGAGPFSIGKPTTEDVLECSGALADGAPAERELGGELCAAFNRGVAGETTLWRTTSAYHPVGTPHNDYAAFFHMVGIDGQAYGFPYDDINDRSTARILPNTEPPSRVTLGIGW